MTEQFYGTRYGPIQYSSQPYNVIVRFMNQDMSASLDVEVDNIVERLSLVLRLSFWDLGGVLRRGERRVVDRMLGPDRTFIASSYFGLDDIQIIHHFLGRNVTAPSGGF